MYLIRTHTLTSLADTLTPVSLYLKVRDIFPRSILLESSDYHGGRDNYSFICLEPLAGIIVDNGQVRESFPGRDTEIVEGADIPALLDGFISQFESGDKTKENRLNGFFGYMGYDAACHFEAVPPPRTDDLAESIPEIRYHLYHYLIAINHFRNTVTLIENRFDDEPSTLATIQNLLVNRNFSLFPFSAGGDCTSNLTDQEYKDLVKAGKHHCHIGDVYQIVLSRRFEQPFLGDEFNVYRNLRSVNPSPYLFYFDYGSYKIFGSSPEAHLIVRNGKATIAPIAGTLQRSGDDDRDLELAEQLAADPKENAEHVMLVDLARNDLSRHARNVKVDTYKEIQFFSHVLHMVSGVSGELIENPELFRLLGDTFPAGTLSGAPKIRAMELIRKYEKTNRGFYGGCIGQIGLDKSLNQAIMIRSFLSIGNHLVFQAGAGIVAGSVENNELQEVNNKLGALREAIRLADNTNSERNKP
ncbi:MAG: chorismate-binding protein [Bacteroidales bacterium]|jgi:anthranilate synthase component 1